MPARYRTRRAAIVAVGLLGLLVGCTLGIRQDGDGLASTWASAHEEIVERAVYRPGSHLDPPVILVFLRPSASTADARRLRCEEWLPAAQATDQDLGVTLWTSNGDWIEQQTVC
jgi:hypothetical protein